MPAERRYRTLKILPEMLAGIFGAGTPEGVFPTEPIPDLMIQDIRYDHWHDRIEALVWSESFDIVPEEQTPPVWQPSFLKRTATFGKVVDHAD